MLTNAGQPLSSSRVAIVGASGALGFGLTLRLAAAGVPIMIGSREVSRANDTAERAGEIVPDGDFQGAENAAAAGGVTTVILCVPFSAQARTLAALGETMTEGSLLIDATVPLAVAVGGRPTRMLGVWQGSAAQQARELAAKAVRLVSALHTVSAAALADLTEPLAEDVLICGDARADKREAAALIGRIDGLRCVDCGRLEHSRTTEALAALLIAVNSRYKTRAGVRLTGLPDTLWE